MGVRVLTIQRYPNTVSIFGKVVMEVFAHEKLKALGKFSYCFGLNRVVSLMPTANSCQERRCLLFYSVQIEPDGSNKEPSFLWDIL